MDFEFYSGVDHSGVDHSVVGLFYLSVSFAVLGNLCVVVLLLLVLSVDFFLVSKGRLIRLLSRITKPLNNI